MLGLNYHSTERLRERFLISHDEINRMYSDQLYIPIGKDSEATHLLFWSKPDQQGVVALVGDNREIITLMNVVYHQNQSRFVFDYSQVENIKTMVESVEVKRVDLPNYLKYRFRATYLDGSVKSSNDNTLVGSEPSTNNFKTSKLRSLVPQIKTMDSVILIRGPKHITQSVLNSLFFMAFQELYLKVSK